MNPDVISYLITLVEWIKSAAYFILGLGLLVFIHELGHFLVAKLCGIRVEQFSLGFGPRLIGFQKGETEYRLSLLPLGGYVKMAGEEPEDGKIEPIQDPRRFDAQPLHRRAAVALAGPAMNLLLTFLIMPLAFMIGHREPAYLSQPPVVPGIQAGSPAEKAGLQKGDLILSIEGAPTPTWDEAMKRILLNPGQTLPIHIKNVQGVEETKTITLAALEEGKAGFLGIEPGLFLGRDPVVGDVSPKSPAAEAGLQTKDLIVSINEEAVSDWEAMTEKVNASKGEALRLEIIRAGQKVLVSVKPQYSEKSKRFILGIGKAMPVKKYPFSAALKRGFDETLKLFDLTLEVFKKLFTFKLSYTSLGGPIQIFQTTSHAANSGFGDFVYFLAFLSLNLGVFNLLPLPVLDGGHLAMMLVEGVRRKPFSMKTRMVIQQIGMALLFTLVILVTFNDLGGLRTVNKIIGWF